MNTNPNTNPNPNTGYNHHKIQPSLSTVYIYTRTCTTDIEARGDAIPTNVKQILQDQITVVGLGCLSSGMCMCSIYVSQRIPVLEYAAAAAHPAHTARRENGSGWKSCLFVQSRFFRFFFLGWMNYDHY